MFHNKVTVKSLTQTILTEHLFSAKQPRPALEKSGVQTSKELLAH